MGRERERDGGEVHDALDARRDEPVGRLLRPLRRHHDHAETNALRLHHLGQFVDVLDANALHRLADLRGIGVEGRLDRKVLPAEAAVAEQRLAEVAHADHHHGPGMIGAEDVAHRADELVAAIAHAGIAKLPEEAEVLAHLGVAEAQERAELPRGDRLLPRGLQTLQLPQVEGETADDDLRHRGVGGNLAGLGSWVGHASGLEELPREAGDSTRLSGQIETKPPPRVNLDRL